MTASSLQPTTPPPSTKQPPIPPAELKKNEKKMFMVLTAEERSSVFTTLKSWLETPFPSVDPTMRLYIEQQLSNLTGYSISSETTHLTLPVLQTVMSAMPHIKRTPQDTLTQHSDRLEAGISRDRSFFGWLVNSQSDQISSPDVLAEQYGVYLPLHLLPDWQNRRDQIMADFKKQLTVVINPFTMSMVVARCIGWWPPSSSHPSSGGSPELITSAQVWHPTSLGRVVMFLINTDDSSRPLEPGPITWTE